MKSSILLVSLVTSFNLLIAPHAECATGAEGESAGTKLDTSLEPPPESTNAVSNIYRDMVVVQRRAKVKGGHYLLNTFGSFDFSDGPTTMYGFNINPGYAVSDTFEIYLNLVPYFFASERQIVSKVAALELADGSHAKIAYSKPKVQYGAELIWAPMYGKDSWGAHGIVRSDTFTKFGLAIIQYEKDSGFRSTWTIGKTWFVSPLFNFRAAAGGSILQAPVDNTKTIYFAGILEAGSVWYF